MSPARLKLIHAIDSELHKYQPEKLRLVVHLESSDDSATPVCTARGRFVILGKPSTAYPVCTACEAIMAGRATADRVRYLHLRTLLDAFEEEAPS